MEKKIGSYYFNWGRRHGFGVGFNIDKYHWTIDLGIWYIGQEFLG